MNTLTDILHMLGAWLALLGGAPAPLAAVGPDPRSDIAQARLAQRQPDAAQAVQLAARGALLVDVRSRAEWNAGHARDARHLPWLEVREQAARVLPDPDTAIVTYCAIGPRAQVAAERLRALGYRNVVAMQGGWPDLRGAGLAEAAR